MKANVKWVQLSSLNLDALTTTMRSSIVKHTQFHQEFGKMLPKMTALTELSMKRLSRCGIISGLLGALPPQLEVLDLSANSLSISPPFCKALSRMTNLNELDISLCCFNDQVALLSPSLAKCHALTSLHMNGLLFTSGMAVSTLVRGLTQLQLLHLTDCHMEDHHVAELVRSLYHHSHLTSLSLAGNLLANESVQALVDWPHLLCLEEVGLNMYYNPEPAISVVEEALQQSLSFRRIVKHPEPEIPLQKATRDACQRNAIRHTTLLSLCYDPKRAKGSILVCAK